MWRLLVCDVTAATVLCTYLAVREIKQTVLYVQSGAYQPSKRWRDTDISAQKVGGGDSPPPSKMGAVFSAPPSGATPMHTIQRYIMSAATVLGGEKFPPLHF